MSCATQRISCREPRRNVGGTTAEDRVHEVRVAESASSASWTPMIQLLQYQWLWAPRTCPTCRLLCARKRSGSILRNCPGLWQNSTAFKCSIQFLQQGSESQAGGIAQGPAKACCLHKPSSVKRQGLSKQQTFVFNAVTCSSTHSLPWYLYMGCAEKLASAWPSPCPLTLTSTADC